MADPRELMQRYQDGDAHAFRELYALVAPRLFGYLMKLTRSRASADDLLQHTFLKIHRARASYVRDADPLPWMYSIAHRTFLDEVRRDQRAIVRTGGDDLPEIPAGIPGESAARSDEPRAAPARAKAPLDALADLPTGPREAGGLPKVEDT